MELNEILEQRWSCRAFDAEPVEQSVLAEVFTLAQRTPSWCNTQPWQVHLLSGDAREALSKALVESVLSGSGGSDYPLPDYVGIADDRRKVAGFGLYAALDIARDDKLARGAQMLKNFEFFGAPHVAVISAPTPLGTYAAIDCGLFVQSFLLAAQSRGVATVAQAALAQKSDFLRGWLGLAEDRSIVCGISFGYADPDHPANSFRADRADLDELARFHQ